MVLNDKNLYNILNIEPDCSQDQIKQAYRKMITKYHPDKYSGPINDKQIINDKFIDIRNAYEILSDVDKKRSYDMLEASQQNEFYDNLKTFIKQSFSDSIDIDKYVKIFFDDDTVLKNYVNNFDFYGIYKQIISRVSDIDANNIGVNNIPENLNIVGTIYTTLSEKYNNKYRKLQIKRKTREDLIIFVPLKNTKYVLEGEGEKEMNKTCGDIILTIETTDELPINYYIDKNILYITEYISLHDYLYGGEVILDIFSNKIPVKFDSFIEKFPTIKLHNKGFMTSAVDSIDDESERGDVYVIFKIKSLDELRPYIKNIIC